MKKNQKMKKFKTERGFQRVEFKDSYGEECSVQESSSCEASIWLGIDKPALSIMARDAADMGRSDLLEPGPERYNGWVEWPVPEQVSRRGRMHLSQEQVKELLPLLEHFAKTGFLP